MCLSLEDPVHPENCSWACVLGNVWVQGRRAEDEEGETDRA